MPGSQFDALAEDYDAARPSYPDGVYQAIEQATGPLAGQLVLDGGAGTGIATRQLATRGARTVALDLGERMLRRAQAHSPGACFVLADGNAIPLRDGCVDLACFAQSWHWFAGDQAVHEVARVLRPGGYWAAWWNMEWASDEQWFDAYQTLLEATFPSYDRQHRNTRWADEHIDGGHLFENQTETEMPWIWTLSLDRWLAYERSKSYIGQLPPADRDRLLTQIGDLASEAFPDGEMSVRYRTRLRMARRRRSAPAR
jgi:ubiquinone/menaquinone biosynthesis C-methylase UbiE